MKSAEKAIKLSNYKEQSKTEENYMDYFLDNSGNTNSNFKFKMFSQSQWNKLQKTGTGDGSSLRCLKKITS